MLRYDKVIGKAILICALVLAGRAALAQDEGWVEMFDGKSLKGWKANENTDSWQVKDGLLVCHGPRSHLFYVADDKPFKNFHFKAEVKTTKGSNSGIYFHTKQRALCNIGT
jgi:Domain of Unknown Function (DUF1080)